VHGAALAVTIVMIEDDPGHARLIERNLQRAGVANEVRHLESGTAALELLLDPARRDAPPPLVLLDLNLPDMSGIDILTRLKADAHMRLAPVIVLTTTDDEREIRRCYELGCSVYITKPVNYETFADAIRKLGLFLAVIQVPPPPGS
jgi:DNA-binding response OmpR family regulator